MIFDFYFFLHFVRATIIMLIPFLFTHVACGSLNKIDSKVFELKLRTNVLSKFQEMTHLNCHTKTLVCELLAGTESHSSGERCTKSRPLNFANFAKENSGKLKIVCTFIHSLKRHHPNISAAKV